MSELDKTGIHGDSCPCDGPMCVAQRCDEERAKQTCCDDCDYHDSGKQSADGDPEGYGDVLDLQLPDEQFWEQESQRTTEFLQETPTQRAHRHARNEEDYVVNRRAERRAIENEIQQAAERERSDRQLEGVYGVRYARPSTFTALQLRAAVYDVLDTGDLCPNCPTPHPWHFDPLDESEQETSRRVRFVDLVTAKLEERK